jgi:hypothetical protein
MTMESLSKLKSALQHDTNLVSLERFNLMAITWNVASKMEDTSNLIDLLHIPLGNASIGLPDMIVVGLQEIVELSAANVVSAEFTGNTAERSSKWSEAILINLNASERYVDSDSGYISIAECHMVGLWIGFFAKASISSFIQNIQTSSLPRGAGGMLGNKGAVYIRFDIFDTSCCYVNSHFTAHAHKLSKRNDDYEAIMSTPVFNDEVLGKPINIPSNKPSGIDILASTLTANTIKQQQKDIRQRLQQLQQKIKVDDSNRQPITTKITPSVATSTRHASPGRSNNTINTPDYDSDDDFVVAPEHLPSHKSPTSSRSHAPLSTKSSTKTLDSNNNNQNNKLKSIVDESFMFSADDHDIVIFIGDLNYRLSDQLSIDQVYDMIYNHNYLDLIPYDQLTIEKDENYEIFHQFSEGQLLFFPTYKYIPGTNQYDQRPEKKIRIPAWCDRILWRLGKQHHRDAMRSKYYQQYESEMLRYYQENKIGMVAEKFNPGNIIRNPHVLGLEDQIYERVELLEYQSCPQFTISDHKPVRAMLSINVKK